jgi:O-acetylhomoserine (thiol)-lyase
VLLLAKQFGPFAFNCKLRGEIFRNLGACMSPFTAYLQSLELETLQLRLKRLHPDAGNWPVF